MHAESGSTEATDWNEIVGLSDVLMRASPSPVVELNRAVAVAGVGSGKTLRLSHLSRAYATGCLVRIWVPSISLERAMISGAHVVVYSKDADADRAFFRDVLGFKSVDAGHGWLIFALPPGEAAFHPSEKNGLHELYFMCEDLKAEMASLATKDVKCSKVEEARWGLITKMHLPGGGEVGLYQPNHPTALGLK